jgi:hypothetical protein
MGWQQQEAEVQHARSWQERQVREQAQVRVMPLAVDPASSSATDYRVHMLLIAFMLLIALVLTSMQ